MSTVCFRDCLNDVVDAVLMLMAWLANVQMHRGVYYLSRYEVGKQINNQSISTSVIPNLFSTLIWIMKKLCGHIYITYNVTCLHWSG